MRLNILFGGKAGQGVNKTSDIVSNLLAKQGYYIFDYKDSPSLIRGGHNFNILSISDEELGSNESSIDVMVALDDKTISIHKAEMKKQGLLISAKGFEGIGMNLNIALVGALIKTLGIKEGVLLDEVTGLGKDAVSAAKKGYQSQKKMFDLPKLNNRINVMDGSKAVATGAVNSKIGFYTFYPMTPSTKVANDLVVLQKEKGHKVFQAESEIAVINTALGASFTGARVMIGTSGGGFDLMAEGLSFQGISEIPLVVYLASRSGPGTGMPTYTAQSDLDDALRAGHGEFPRVVIAPGDAIEAIENTNEAFYLSEKFNSLSIILSDKHLAESRFSFSSRLKSPIKIPERKNAGRVVKASSYEHDSFGNTVEDPNNCRINAEGRIKKYEKIKKECEKFEMIKTHGNLRSKNLIIGWGSTKHAIIDAIKGLDFKFLQVIYMKPLSDEIRKEIEKADKVILVEGNVTGQLGRLIREKTGLKIKNRILKYDGRPFLSDELKKQLRGMIK